MDDFGVLVQALGIRGQGKSAPMAASKAAASNRTHNYSTSPNMDPPLTTSKSDPNFNSNQFDPFGVGVFQTKPNGGGVGGLDFDIEAVLKGSLNLNSETSGDWGFDGVDLLSSDPAGVDYWGNLGGIGSAPGLNENKGSSGVDDPNVLIPGFDMSTSTNDRPQASTTQKSSGSSSIEELEDFGSGRVKKNANGSLGVSKINLPNTTFTTKSLEPNLIDVDTYLTSFGGGSIHQEKVENVSRNILEEESPDLDFYFGSHAEKSKPVSEETTRSVKTEELPDLFTGVPVNTQKNMSPGNSPDDFLFFGVASTSTQFEEVDGESKERRSSRFSHYQSTQERMAGALADLNEREFRAQQEQEERNRIGDAMDLEIKRWAAGKEGNLRALLSSLQQILAPELGWKAVTLTDLITSSQVKIAYKKAALCVHPDKVQQKRANLQQKYVAEKVFDFLKEAWNKFNAEELR